MIETRVRDHVREGTGGFSQLCERKSVHEALSLSVTKLGERKKRFGGGA